jgi:hypothetical protein
MTGVQRRSCVMLARQTLGSIEAREALQALRLAHVLRLPEDVQKLFQNRAPSASGDELQVRADAALACH